MDAAGSGTNICTVAAAGYTVPSAHFALCPVPSTTSAPAFTLHVTLRSAALHSGQIA
jgi:hypothetical protein